ncbi:MAG: hypothetical protein HQK58_17870 [Deltaproteobacteria bacterium]|nr:hypothetical protein [Deltaproteobacteria bacterium]
MNMRCKNLRLFSLLFALTLLLQLAGCGNDTNTTNNFPVVVFTDAHFNPFYDPSLFQALNSADAGQWASIFKTSSISAPSTWGTDTNYPLLVLALAGIRQNLGASPLVIYTGDILGHYFPQLFYTYLNGTQNPRNDADVAAMKAFTDKTLAFFMDQVRSSIGNIPVMFAVGNGDSYGSFGPDSSFLSDTAELFYTKFLNGTADHQAFLNTFKSGGYYSAEPLETNMTVIGLNTVIFSPLVPGNNDNAVATELAWLDSKLAAAKADGKKVWLIMHVPPGGDLSSTAKQVDNKGHLTTATMMWNPAYQTSFMQILSKYPGVISLTLAAHTHMDEYRILPSSDVLEITPGISPAFGNNPGFKVFTFSHDTLKPTDYSSLNYDLATMPLQFNSYYTFSTAYSMQGPLDASLTQLLPALVTNSAKQALYRGYYYSGHNSANPITNLNWPVYWSGIGKMDQKSLIDSVNSY